MSDQPRKNEEPTPPIVDELQELARNLREADHLEPEVREEAAELLGKLAEALEEPSVQEKDLALSATQLVRAVKDQHEPGLIEAAWDQVEKAVARAETTAPVATDVVLRLIDVLAGLGI